jgi:hypothetical protein
MLFPIEKMPDTARVWVYQANRRLTDTEYSSIQSLLSEQVRNWAAHGAPLAGAYTILYNRFVVIAVDENINSTSGCSIDASTGWLKAIGANMNIDFFDRSIAYLNENEMKSIDFLSLKKAVLEGNIQPNTLIFNNLVSSYGEFKNGWQIKAVDSWLKKYFTSVPA